MRNFGMIAFAFLLSATQGCSKMQATNLQSSEAASSVPDTNNGKPPASGGDGSIQLRFLQPVSTQIAPSLTIEVEATPIENLRGIRLYVNDNPIRSFTRLPFQHAFNTGTISGDTIVIRAESEDQDGKLNFTSLTLTRQVSNPTGGGGVSTSLDNSRQAGQFDPNCYTNPNVDACVFFKNPVAHKGSAFPSLLRFGTDLTTTQTFAVKLENLTNPTSLRNGSLRITASDGTVAVLNNGKLLQEYQSDQGTHYTAQLMSYFWLNFQINATEARSGVFYAKNKSILVDAYSAETTNNAYWDGGSRQIVLGARSSSGTAAHEMALSAEVSMHEMGHANLQYAVGGFSNLNPSSSTTRCSSNCYCLTSQGCIGAINEGQADFHYLVHFRDSIAIAETFSNNINGWSDRNVLANANVSVDEMFQQSQGEVHDMGAIYAAILWKIYSNAQVDKKEFEKIFMNHLQALSGSSRFADSREALLAQDEQLFQGKYQAIIEAAFSSQGVTN